MPFTTTVEDRSVFGDKRWVFGTAIVGDPIVEASGSIPTGLRVVQDFSMTIVSGTTAGEANQVSGALLISGFAGNAAGDVDIISSLASGTQIRWRAYGTG